MPAASGSERARKWVSVAERGWMELLVAFIALLVVAERASAINYRKDSGFVSDGRDQFVFREPSTVSSPGTAYQREPEVKRTGRVRFVDNPDRSSHDLGGSGGFFGKGTVTDSSPGGSSFFQREREGDQFYTVGASIQFAGSPGDAITPPPPVEAQLKPKRKKNKYKYGASDKVYNAAAPEQGQFPAYSNFGEAQRYSTPLQGNYLTANGARPQGAQYDGSISNYPELQRPQYPFSVNSPNFPGGAYYNGQQTSGGYSPYQYQYQYPYTGPYQQDNPQAYYPQQQPSPGLGQPPNAQSILGVLQSIFNFAPGTFGSFGGPTRPTGAYSGVPANFGGVGGQLRQALDNISENDELQCVPKLICMMSRSSTGQGFSSYVNRGLLSTILTAVPDSSPWLKFSRAALLGYGIGANSCDAYYPKCPKDEMQILYYLNNHRGGFFRFFSNGEQGIPQQQQPQFG